MERVIELDKVLWCSNCGIVEIIPDKIACANCKGPLEEIGFTESRRSSYNPNKTYNSGGRLTPGTCKCGKPLALKGVDNDGRNRYRTSCNTCRHTAQRLKGNKCEACGLVPESRKMLEIDHIDADRSNNRPSNIQTLCKSCHQEKTLENKDWKRKK